MPVAPKTAAGPRNVSGFSVPCSNTEKNATPPSITKSVVMLSAIGSSKYQPGRPVSCSLRQPAASMGIRTASWKTEDRTRDPCPVSGLVPNMIVSSTANTALTRTTNKKNHQYSDRKARPENWKYFEKHVFTASTNPMFLSLRRFLAASKTLGRVGNTRSCENPHILFV